MFQESRKCEPDGPYPDEFGWKFGSGGDGRGLIHGQPEQPNQEPQHPTTATPNDEKNNDNSTISYDSFDNMGDRTWTDFQEAAEIERQFEENRKWEKEFLGKE